MRHCTASPPIIAGPGRRPVDSFSSCCPGAAPTRHPVSVVWDLTSEQLDDLLGDGALVESVSVEISDLDAALGDPVTPEIAYCSPEFGPRASLIRGWPRGAGRRSPQGGQ